MTTTHPEPPTIVEAILAALPAGHDLTVAPVWQGRWTPRSADVFLPGRGRIIVTPSPDAEYDVTVGVYDLVDSDPEIAVDIDGTPENVALLVAFLVTHQPEGTDWSAWAALRIVEDMADGSDS